MSDSAKDSLDYAAGDVVDGRYRIEGRLGAGGFGVVFRATQLSIGREVALKVLHAEMALSGTSLRRFLREAKIAQQLDHPNTVHLYDVGQTSAGHPYISYQLLEGRTVREALDAGGPFDAARVAHLTIQALRSLGEAHALGIAHRDIKPDNLFLTAYEGEEDHLKVLDFGLAKPTDASTPSMAVTEGAMVIGTPQYMAPEQINSEQSTAATDIYALGLVMGEMLTGRAVVEARQAIVLFAIHLDDEPLPLPDAVLASPLAQVIERAVAKDPRARWSSTAEMIEALERVDCRGVPAHSSDSAPAGYGTSIGVETNAPAAPSGGWVSAGFGEAGIVEANTLAAPSSGAALVPAPAAPRRGRQLLFIILTLLFLLLLVEGLAVFVIGQAGTEVSSRAVPISNSTPAASPPQTAAMPTPWGAPLPPVPLAKLVPTSIANRAARLGWTFTMPAPYLAQAHVEGGLVVVLRKAGIHGNVMHIRYTDAHYATLVENTTNQRAASAARWKNLVLTVELHAANEEESQRESSKLLNALIISQ